MKFLTAVAKTQLPFKGIERDVVKRRGPGISSGYILRMWSPGEK